MQERDAIDRVIEALEPLAAKIGDTAAHVYEVLVREAILTGFTSIATAIAVVVLAWVLFLRGRAYWESLKRRGLIVTTTRVLERVGQSPAVRHTFSR